MNGVGDRIESERKRLGLSQRQLSERAGLAPGVVGHIVSGRTKRPTLETIAAIAAALGVPTAALAGPELVVEVPEGARHAAERFARANALPEWAIRETLADEALRDATMAAEDWYFEMRARARRGRPVP